MTTDDINICKNMVNHLLSENTNLKKQINSLIGTNKLLEAKLPHFLENLNESWIKDYEQLFKYSKKLEQIIIHLQEIK